MSSEEVKQLRSEVEAAIARGNPGRAAQCLARLWLTAPSVGSAGFIDRRFQAVHARLGTPFYRVAILRSFTVEPVVPLLRCEAAAWGLPMEVRTSEFNAYSQEILDSNSDLYNFDPHAVVLALQTRDIASKLWDEFAGLSSSEVLAAMDRVVAEYRQLISTFRERSAATMVVHTLEVPAEPSWGIYDSQKLSGQCETIRSINRRLSELAQEFSGVYLLDYDGLIAKHGRRDWFDAVKWQTVRLPIKSSHLIHLAQEWTRLLLPAAGRVAKALVCDLDNTLWGGIVGEDGLEGIQIGLEHPGAMYRELQRAIRELHSRGVILAICSKNNADDVQEVFSKHEHMLLRDEQFAAIRINWQDKAKNLREIAAELNIGIDSLVLLDDNPIEQEFVRDQLPEVTVLEWNARPESAVELLRSCPLFERLSLSEEDAQRGAMYVSQRLRAASLGAARTVEDYYHGLEMTMEFGQASSTTIPRIAQLTQKTNQLNMTTRRYTEQQIVEFAEAIDHRVYWVRLVDRFGDNGLVGVVIARTEGAIWRLDTFLMSCRVIGRTVETAMLAEICREAIVADATQLQGEFIPTKKNAPAKDIYRDHDFACIQENDSGALWSLQLPKQAVIMPEWIRCQHRDENAIHV